MTTIRLADPDALTGTAREIADGRSSLRHGGDTDRDVLEVLGVVDQYTTLNALSEDPRAPVSVSGVPARPAPRH